MVLKSPKSKLSIVNLFADFILNQIPKEEQTIIQVVDCYNFYVIKGKTTHTEPLNLANIRDEFISKYEELIGDSKVSHTIDLIDYNSKLKSLNSLSFRYYYGSENCSYTILQSKSYLEDPSMSYAHDQIFKPMDDENSLVYTSEFPHGYSLSQGRLLYYYGKHIFYNIPSSYPINTLIFNLSVNKEESGDQVFSVMHSNQKVDDVLTSAILDVFDFDMSWLNTETKKVDWSIELTNPLQDYDFLKKKVDGFVIF
jgi:hypothetical protein